MVVILLYFIGTLVFTLISQNATIICMLDIKADANHLVINTDRDYRLELSDPFMLQLSNEQTADNTITKSLNALFLDIQNSSMLNHASRANASQQCHRSGIMIYEAI